MANMMTNVRNAKAQLSALIARAARGEEVVITSGGKPKARLLGVAPAIVPFRVNERLLAIRSRRGRGSEFLIRDDRDSRA